MVGRWWHLIENQVEQLDLESHCVTFTVTLTLIDVRTHNTGKGAGTTMATTTTTAAKQLVRIVGAVAGAGLAVKLWPDGGGDGGEGASIDTTEDSNNGSNRFSHTHYNPRLRLLQHLDVRLVPGQQQRQQQQQHGETAMKALPPPPSWLMHHFGQEQGKEDEKDDRQHHQEEEQQQQQDQRPFVFISCLDPCVMENLVQDVLELR